MASQPPQTEIYTIELPDGSQVDIEGPAGANEAQLHEFVQSQGMNIGGAAQASPMAEPTAPGAQQQVPEQVDRSARIAMADTNPGTAVLSTETKTVKSPYLTRYGDQLGRMVAAGVPDAEIQDFLKQTGAPAGELNIGEALNFRHTPQFAEWKRQNPGKPYPFNPEMTVPLTAEEKAGAELRANPVINTIGTAATGAADTLLLGGFDEAASFADPDFAQKQQLAAADNPVAYTIGQIAGATGLPTGALSAGSVAARVAMRDALSQGLGREAAREAAKAAARKAIIARSGMEGAAYGGAYGAGSSNGDILDRAADGIAGAVTGAAAGAGGAGLGTRLAARAERAPVGLTAQQEALQASQRLAERGTPVDMLPADAAGPTIKRLTGAATQAPLSASPIINKAASIIEQAKGARDAVANSVGRVDDVEAVGEAAARGARNYITRSRNRIGRIYDVAGSMAGDTKLPLPNAKAILDDQIARLEAVPGGGSGLQEAKDLRAALEGNFTVQGVRDMRTEMFVAPEFRGTPVERRMRQIVDAAARDIEEGLQAQGKGDAARTFAEADRQWRERINTISRVIEPIIGKSGDALKSGEEVVGALQRAAKGNNQRLRAFIKTLPDDEASMVRAKFIDSLGTVPAGRQNAEGSAFSMGQFLTDWNKLSKGAKNTLFNDEARAALDDLAIVAERSKDTQKYANMSNTAGAIWGNLGLLAGGSAISPVAAGAGLTAQVIGGRLLANPRFARWLARAPKTQLSAPAYVERLSRIASAEPAIATDVLGLQKRLLEAFSGSAPMRAAADESGNGALGVPQQQAPQDQNYSQELPQ